MACTDGITSTAPALPIDDPQLNRKKFFETFREPFRRDFDFPDVAEALVNHNVLTKSESEEIMNLSPEMDGEKQHDRLFFLLTYNEKKSIRKFVDAIRDSYEWLSMAMEAYHPEHSNLVVQLYETCIDRSWIPNKINVHVHRCKFLWEIVQNLRTLKRQHYLIIRGKMGIGKDWLAIAACTDYSVIRSTDFQLYWLNVTKCDSPEGILTEMQRLKILLSSTYHGDAHTGPGYDTVQMRILQLRKHFCDVFSSDKYKNALLVLCNVTNKEVLDAFDFNCKIVVTGRNESCFDEIPNNRKRFVVIDRGLTEQESLDFFDKLGVFDARIDPSYRQKVREIHHLCHGEPMIMSLISNAVMLPGPSADERLNKYRSKLRRNQLRDEKVRSTIEESLSELPNSAREAYQRMVLFPENIYVPISVLARYWQMNMHETEELVDRLYRSSLLTVDYRTASNREKDTTTTYVSMHYIYSSYLRELYEEDELREMHLDICRAYKVESLLESRTEPELLDLPDDGYVHYYIGYHLQRSGLNHFFSELYFDFGFLEQKLRYTGLPNTLGDLQAYRTEIVGHDKHRRMLWDELLEFLPTIEEMVHQNNDTSLLQYALNASGIIAEEANHQVTHLSHRVWFSDVGHPTKQRRQMVQLPQRPLQLKFFGPDALLAALVDNSILLTGLSPYYETKRTLLKEHTHPIRQLETFGNWYLITLDEGGTLLVWDLRDTPICMARNAESSSSSSRDRPDGSPGGSEPQPVPTVHQLDGRTVNSPPSLCRISDRNFIQCFTICDQSNVINGNGVASRVNGNGNGNGGTTGGRIRLFCGTRENIICSYEWCGDEETFMEKPKCKMEYKNHRAIHYLHPDCLMVLSEDHLEFMNLISTSTMFLDAAWKSVRDALAIYEVRSENHGPVRTIYCVFRECIVRIDVTRLITSLVQTKRIEAVYKTEEDSPISCSTQSDDGRYLVLGTQRGIVVFDCDTDTESQRYSNGYHITSIDMCTSDDFNYRYLMVSATGNGVKERVYIYGLPGIRRHAVGRTLSSDRMKYFWHSGKLIGDIRFEVIRQQEHQSIIYAVEMDNVIHKMRCGNGCVDTETTYEGPSEKITCTGQWCGKFCYGTIDGKFYVVMPDNGNMEPSVKEKVQMTGAIVYIKGIDPYYCIVATATTYKILNWWHSEQTVVQSGTVIDCFTIGPGKMMIVLGQTPAQLVDMSRPMDIQVNYLKETASNVPIIGCEYQAGVLALLNQQGKICFFEVDKESGGVDFKMVPLAKDMIQYRVSTMALSKDAAYLALGMENGKIHIFRMSDTQKLQTLSSHKQSIKDLVFSPWSSEGAGNNPLVLVSLAEQMCFWNIKYVINNPMDSGKRRPSRLSSRFSKLLHKWTSNGDNGDNSTNDNESNGTITNGNGKAKHQEASANYWDDKKGAPDKEELLACIKFVGNSATKLVTDKDFNQFITIDNEGDIYALITRRDSKNGGGITDRFQTISLSNTLSTLSS